MRAFLIILLFLAGTARALAGPLEDPLDDAAVRAEVIARMRAAGVFDTVEARPDGTIALSWGDGEGSSYLGNLILDMRAAEPAARTAMLDKFVATAVEFATRDGAAIDPADLRLNLYTTAYIEEIAASESRPGNILSPEEAMQPRRHVAGDLWALVVHDTPVSAWFLDAPAIAAAGLSETEAWQLAEAGLQKQAQELRLVPRAGYWAVELDGFFENAMMLIDDIWPRIAGEIDGTPVVASPTRGVLLIAPAEESGRVSRMAAEAEELYWMRGHPLSRHLYQWTGRGWESREGW